MTTTADGTRGVVFNDNTAQSSATGIKSLGTTGYYKFPNGTFMQWGTYNGGTNGGTAPFPITFTACLCAFATKTNGRGTTEAIRFTNSNITVLHGTSTGKGNPYPMGGEFRWFAIGY
jgi:hypothetical protein